METPVSSGIPVSNKIHAIYKLFFLDYKTSKIRLWRGGKHGVALTSLDTSEEVFAWLNFLNENLLGLSSHWIMDFIGEDVRKFEGE